MRRGRALGLMIMVMGLVVLVVSCGGRMGYVKGEPTPIPQEWEEARRQAEVALEGALWSLAEKEEHLLKSWGFKDRDEVGRGELGEPMLVCHLNERDIKAYSRHGRIAPLLACLPRWYFPVLVDGKGKAVIMVHHTREDDDWGTGVGIGGGDMPEAMHELRVILESDPRFRGKSYDVKLVTFDWEYGPSTCFVEVDGEEYFVPLWGGDWSIGERLKFYPVREVIWEVERRSRELREGREKVRLTPPPRR